MGANNGTSEWLEKKDFKMGLIVLELGEVWVTEQRTPIQHRKSALFLSPRVLSTEVAWVWILILICFLIFVLFLPYNHTDCHQQCILSPPDSWPHDFHAEWRQQDGKRNPNHLFLNRKLTANRNEKGQQLFVHYRQLPNPFTSSSPRTHFTLWCTVCITVGLCESTVTKVRNAGVHHETTQQHWAVHFFLHPHGALLPVLEGSVLILPSFTSTSPEHKSVCKGLAVLRLQSCSRAGKPLLRGSDTGPPPARPPLLPPSPPFPCIPLGLICACRSCPTRSSCPTHSPSSFLPSLCWYFSQETQHK